MSETKKPKTKRKQTQERIEHYKKLHAENSKIAMLRPNFIEAASFYEIINGDTMKLAELAHYLNEANLRTPRGRFFCTATVLQLRKKINKLKEQQPHATTN
jgi:hypothetical protein